GNTDAAVAYGAPFVSGKDSFYNYFETEDGPVSIPVTILISGMGIVEDASHVTGASLRRDDSVLAIIGHTQSELGGSVYARQAGLNEAEVPTTDLEQAMKLYRQYYKAVQEGLILSSHDVSEGGLATTLAEAAFSGKAGLEIDLSSLPMDDDASKAAMLFGESPSRLVIEVAPENLEAVADLFEGLPFAALGRAAAEHQHMNVVWGKETLINESIDELKSLWKNGLAQYY
ncbi:MAG: AIR synthase-related protein, partial [Verrucomicrobiota bacterium]